MAQFYFPISAQLMIISDTSVSLRLMFNKCDNSIDSITLKGMQTLSINSVSIEIEPIDDWGDSAWLKYKVHARTGKDSLAIDLNFMGNEYRINEADAIHKHHDEICFDLCKEQEKAFEFWLKRP